MAIIAKSKIVMAHIKICYRFIFSFYVQIFVFISYQSTVIIVIYIHRRTQDHIENICIHNTYNSRIEICIIYQLEEEETIHILNAKRIWVPVCKCVCSRLVYSYVVIVQNNQIDHKL